MKIIPLENKPLDFLFPHKKYCLLLIEQTENNISTFEFIPLACRISFVSKRMYLESTIPEIHSLLLDLPRMAILAPQIHKEYQEIKTRLQKIKTEKNKQGIAFSNRIAMLFYGDKVMAEKIIKSLKG